MKVKKSIYIVVSLTLISLFGGCSGLEVLSKWQESNLIIDGSKQDWGNNLKYIKDEKVAVGITNDEQNLYLCLVVSENERIIKLLKSGLTIWFEPQSSDVEKFGIQYPIKNNTTVVMDFSKRLKPTGRRVKQERVVNKLLIEQNEFLVLNEDEYPLYASPLKSNNGIEVKIGYEFGQLVYELKISLVGRKESLLKINTTLNEEIKLGFIAGKIERPERSGEAEMGNKSGGKSGGGQKGGMSGGRRGGSSGRGRQQNINSVIEPINFWINTAIASN